MGDENAVARAGDFDLVALGSFGVPAFEIGVDGSVASGYQHPAWFGSPRSRSDGCAEIVAKIEDLRTRHESSLLRGQVRCKQLVKSRRVGISETVRRVLYRR